MSDTNQMSNKLNTHNAWRNSLVPKQASRKPDIFWGIKTGTCVLPFTIRSTRKKCISDYCEDRGMTLKQLQKTGHNYVKLSVKEVK